MPPRKTTKTAASNTEKKFSSLPTAKATSPSPWLSGNKGLFFSLAIPVVLGIGLQHFISHQFEYRGTLHVNHTLQHNQTYQLGVFQVKWANGSLSVWPTSSDRQHSLWHTPPNGIPFLLAAHSDLDGDPIRDGHYFLKEKFTESTNIQTINEIEYDTGGPSSLSILGILQGPTISIPYRFTFYPDGSYPTNKLRFAVSLGAEGENDEAEFKDEIGSVNRLFLRYGTDKQENFYGFGQHYSKWNLKGHRIPILISEQGVGRGLQPLTFALNMFVHGVGSCWHTTYVAKPIYVTSYMRSLVLEGPRVSVFDLTKADVVTVEHWSTGLKGMILNAKDSLDLVSIITTETGRMQPLPDWTQQGVIVGLEGGSTEVENITQVLLKEKVPLAGVWLQDWVGTRHAWDGTRLIWNWEVNTAYYPRWDSLRADLAQQNVKVLTYINPYLVDVKDKFPHTRNLFQEAVDHGYLVKNLTGQPLFAMSGSIEFGTIDPTNPGTRQWLKEVITQNMIEKAGSSGWMADFGEYVPFHSQLYAGSGDLLHNQFPDYWASLQREAILESNNPEAIAETVFFVRSGHTKTPGIAQLYWIGDQLVTWDNHDGIKTVLLALQSGGLVGHSLSHSDVGGYTMIDHPIFKFFRSRELLFRWVELGAFAGAIYRTHLGSFMHTPSAQVWDDVESIQHFAQFSRIFVILAPYRKFLMEEASMKGWPLIRALFLHFSEDRLAYDLPLQFLLGQDLLVAPVLDPGVTVIRVYLPAVEGGWVHVWTSRLIGKGATSGEWVKVAAEIGHPPVFYRYYSAYKHLFEKIASQ